MAADDFTDVRDRALYLARRQTTNTHAAARAGELVNECHKSICDSGDPWDFLEGEGTFTLTSGDDLYSYSDITTGLGITTGTLDEVMAMIVKDESDPPLQQISWIDLEHRAGSSQQTGETTGQPAWWTQLGETIRFYPKPDRAYPIFMKFKKRAATLTGTDAFLIPSGWLSRIVIPYVATRLLWEDGSRDALMLADRINVKYDEDFISMRNALAYPDEGIQLRSAGFTDDLDTIDADYFSVYDT